MATKKKISSPYHKKRNIFSEMLEGVEAMCAHREDKITLRHYKVERAPLPRVQSPKTPPIAGMAESVDAVDLKSTAHKSVRVQPSLPVRPPGA